MQTWIIRVACLGLFVVVAPQQDVQADGFFGWGHHGSQECKVINSPVGSRQKCRKGLIWPPRPRPTGKPQKLAEKYHAAHYWPWPYVCQDRAVIEGTSLTQIENGWLTATTLYDFHFDSETGELNTSGRRHLQWVLTHVPEEYQQLHVAESFQPGVTDLRSASVENELAQMSASLNVPVSLRVAAPLTRSASTVEAIDRAAIQSMPAPTIEYQSISAEAGQ